MNTLCKEMNTSLNLAINISYLWKIFLCKIPKGKMFNKNEIEKSQETMTFSPNDTQRYVTDHSIQRLQVCIYW